MIRLTFIISFIILSNLSSFAQFEIYSIQTSLGSKVNSPSQERNCVISPDGKKLYFTRVNHPANIGGKNDKGDVWVSELASSGEWTDAVNLGRPVNNEDENAIIGFMDDGKAMLLHSKLGMKFTYHKEGKWTRPVDIRIPYYKEKSSHVSGSISADGKTILFAMESFGTYGVEDLYVTQLKSSGKWTTPKNLGESVNTSYQERNPFIAADNKTLFFATNGRGGEGSFDIFMSERLDDTWQKWSKPMNLGKKVNTKGQEYSFTFKNEAHFAYLISTQNSDGYGDIKKVRITPHITAATNSSVSDSTLTSEVALSMEDFISIDGTIYNKKTKRPIANSKFKIITEPDEIVYDVETNASGKFSLMVLARDEYNITITADKFLKHEGHLTSIELNESNKIKYYLSPLTKGSTIQLDHVLFVQGTAKLVGGSEKQLDLIVEMLKENPTIYIYLKGHTDNRGNAVKNLDLSTARMETVQSYLIANGIQRKRVQGQGYGGLKPIASNASEVTRKLNRRVEFTIK